MLQPPDRQLTSTTVAFSVAALGIALFSGMDALMKVLSLQIGTYNALLWRTLASAVLAGSLFLATRSRWPARPVLRVHLTRGLISLPMALLFFWGLARVPMAQAIALSFVASLLSLYLAAVLLGERIERRALGASLLGFGGVLLIFAGQAEANLGPEALAGSLAILCSAGIYAYNIILMRRQALLAGPVEVAFFVSTIMAAGFAVAAPVLAELPALKQVPAIIGAAVLAFGSLMLLSWAYARAEAQHLAPVEYTSFIWAAILGLLIFDEQVRPFTVAGAVLIVIGCIIAARRRAPPDPDVDAGVHA
ncbi:MAG TPA: DMT family transporter [Allosphingosinicella sp.]|jgi:S-adenosylmethionine uptake transporter|uniref:DMT family transporter n=1 Tax=Allosphingosinicella sp. TaxID=2823234 RepID=UPI002F2A5634